MNIARRTSAIRSRPATAWTRATPSLRASRASTIRADAPEHREHEQPSAATAARIGCWGLVASPGCGRRDAQSIGQLLQKPFDHGHTHLTARDIMVPEPPRQNRFEQEQDQQAIKQAADAARRAGRPSATSWASSSEVRQIKKVPARQCSAKCGAVELGQIALGRDRGWRRTTISSESGGPICTWYRPARSVCSKWNWLTPPAACSLVATRPAPWA